MNPRHYMGEAGPDCMAGAPKSIVTNCPNHTYQAPEPVSGRIQVALLVVAWTIWEWR